jgi:uncharacterized membrane protein
MTDPNKSAMDDKKVEVIVANLLRAGVLLAAIVVLIGGVKYLAQEGTKPHEYTKFDPNHNPELHSPSGIIREAIHLNPRGIIALGLLILIATPVARVLFTVFAFWMERDYTYVVVTLIVLAVLLYSIFFAKNL